MSMTNKKKIFIEKLSFPPSEWRLLTGPCANTENLKPGVSVISAI